MNDIGLNALEHLFGEKYDNQLPLPPELATLYGHFFLPIHAGKPYIIGNFVPCR